MLAHHKFVCATSLPSPYSRTPQTIWPEYILLQRFNFTALKKFQVKNLIEFPAQSKF